MICLELYMIEQQPEHFATTFKWEAFNCLGFLGRRATFMLIKRAVPLPGRFRQAKAEQCCAGGSGAAGEREHTQL